MSHIISHITRGEREREREQKEREIDSVSGNQEVGEMEKKRGKIVFVVNVMRLSYAT